MKDLTKPYIAEKMKELMKQKPVSKIRVSELCEALDIERSTFYYHFKDKYELVAWIFFQTMNDVDVLDEEDAARSMERMKADILFYRQAYSDASQNALWKYMVEYFVEAYTERAKQLLGTGTLDYQTAFSIRHYCFGSVSMTREWVLEDNLTPALVVVNAMFASMPEPLRAIYFQ